jgi:hypothetical protein
MGKSNKEARRSSFVDAFNQQTYEGNDSFHSESCKPSDDDFDDDDHLDDTSYHLARMDPNSTGAGAAHGADSSQSSAAADPIEIAREHARALRTWRILVGVALVVVGGGVLVTQPLLWRRQQDEAHLRNVRV